MSGAVVRPGASVAANFVAACLHDHRFRGPDFQAEWEDQVGCWHVHLGHTRLSIIDLSPSGNQPMTRDEVVVSYNGEIYNYIELRDELRGLGHDFKTSSDTEVLIAAYQQWGDASFQRLNGMFALALVDRPRRRLWLIRDRFGVKPLYFHDCPGRLLFSSTARPIAQVVGLDPNLEYLSRGLATGRFERETDASQYERVRAVPAGHACCFALDADRLTPAIRRYYDLRARVEQAASAWHELGDADAVEACRAQLDDAVKLRLRSDVPVGVSLSGGIDSSTVAAFAAKRHPEIVGFSFSEPSHPETEGALVRELAAQTGIQVHYVFPDAPAMERLFWDCLDAQDEPFATGSIVAQYAVYQRARAEGVRVILAGQGGDEAFLGYRKALLWQLRDSRRAKQLASVVKETVGLWKVVAAELAHTQEHLSELRARSGWGPRSVIPLTSHESHNSDTESVRNNQIWDLTAGGLPTLLRYEDRNSMAASVESRLPYMDYRLIEWALVLPTEQKVRDGFGKWVLRRAAAGQVPDHIVKSRVKRGFDVRTAGWIRAGLGATIRREITRFKRALRAVFGWTINVDTSFDDHALAHYPRRLLEATTAIWLGRIVQ